MKKKWFVSALVVSMSALLLAGCKKKEDEQPVDTAIPVTVAPVVWKNIDVKFSSVGSITSQDTPLLRAQTTGRVENIVVKIGDQVHEGQLLMTLSQDDQVIGFEQAKANYAQAQARDQEAALVAERKGILAKRGIVSQMEFDEAVTAEKVAHSSLDVAKYQLQAAKLQLEKTQITSPINGYVQSKTVSIGDKVNPGTALIQLTDPTKLRATLPFAEEKALYFALGQKVNLTSLANPNQSLQAAVTNIAPNIDPKNRAINVIVDFDNTQNWKPGASIRGYVIALANYKALIVPETSVVNSDNGPAVFVVKKNKAIETSIQSGYNQDGNAVVLKGLKAGQLVVVDGVQYLNNDALVKITNSPAAPTVSK